MALTRMRRAVRRLVPRRIRWVLRFGYRVVTLWYFRQVMKQAQEIKDHLAAQAAQIEVQSEVLDFFLKRLHTLEDETISLSQPLRTLQQQIDALHAPLQGLQQEVTAWSQPVHAVTSRPTLPQLSPDHGKHSEGQPSSDRTPGYKVALLCRSLGRRCGIAEYSLLLARRLQAVTVASTAEIPLDTQIVFIQYEPSFYPDTADIINEIKSIRPSVRVVVDAHFIFPEVAEELKWHAIVGVKRDPLPGTVRLPLCLPEAEPAIEQEPRELHFGAFGFAFPAKRYELVIQLAKRLGVKATILAAHNNATDWQADLSASYLQSLKNMASEGIEIVDDYLAHDDVVRRLRRCSHLISSMEDNGAQSASLRTLAAVGRPLISLDTAPARSVGATLVENLDDISVEFLENCNELPTPHDGIAEYDMLIQRYAWIDGLAIQLQHDDAIYLDNSIQMERLDWLREHVSGRTIDIGIGNGFTTNYLRAGTGAEVRPDRLAYASLRFPHIDFRLLDAKLQVLGGFDTVVFGEIIEHMPFAEARQMLALWAETKPQRILVTTPNAGKPEFDQDLVYNPEHVWEPTEESVRRLVPKGYAATISTSGDDDFLLMDIRPAPTPDGQGRVIPSAIAESA